MRKSIFSRRAVLRAMFLAGGLAVAATPAPGGEHIDRQIADARATIKLFAARLQGELKGALNSVGAGGAIGVCNVAAPEIAAQTSRQSAWTVGRTALRLRNPSNAPDAWERRVLEDFVRRKEAGANPAELERYEIVENQGRRELRYMKAIATAKLCLACHGGAVEPALLAEIRKRYPEDRATGFREGDIRGAFTLSRPLP